MMSRPGVHGRTLAGGREHGQGAISTDAGEANRCTPLELLSEGMAVKAMRMHACAGTAVIQPISAWGVGCRIATRS
jgi:hypothetical protein